MIDVYQFLQQADRYMDGEMTYPEKLAFEELCKLQEAKTLLDEHRMLRSRLKQYDERKSMRAKLDQINTANATSGQASKSIRSASSIISMKKIIWKVAGVAAAITLLITAGGLWVSHNYNSHKISSYTVLRREIDYIKQSQNSLMHDMNKVQKPIPADPGQYGGTGFAISDNGYVATNVHVIKDADSIYVETSKGDAYKASLVYEDKTCDLAILKIEDSTFQIPPPPYRLKKAPAPLGDEVYTLGYPRDEIVYGKGYISSETGFRGDTNAYQVAIPVNPGNSGGPLVDSKGQILGIITGKESPSDDVAFAVKSSFLINMLDSLPKSFNKNALLRPHALGNQRRVDQIKQLQPYIFLIKVYN